MQDLSSNEIHSNTFDCVENTDDLSNELNRKLKFDPPLYIQRYEYLNNLIKIFECKSIMDIGCAECKLLHLLKQNNQDLNLIVGVDIDKDLLVRSTQKFTDVLVDFFQPREQPLDLYMIQGNIAEPDEYFLNKFCHDNSGLEFVSLIEIIEHMYPDVLDKCIDTVFDKLRPRYVLITTPNEEYNIVFEELDPGSSVYDERKINQKFRHWDHKFEWTRNEFETWCQNRILNVYKEYKLYKNSYDGLGVPPEGYENVGYCTQMALFVNESYQTKDQNNNYLNDFDFYLREKKRIHFKNRNLQVVDEKIKQELYFNPKIASEDVKKFKLVHGFSYPFETFDFEDEKDRNKALFDEIDYLISFLTAPSKYSRHSYVQTCNSNDSNDLASHLTEEEKEKLDNYIDLYDETIRLAKFEVLFDFNSIQKFKLEKQELLIIMKENGYRFTKNNKYVIHKIQNESDHSDLSESSSIENFRHQLVCETEHIDRLNIEDEEVIETNKEVNGDKTIVFDEENWDQYLPAQPIFVPKTQVTLAEQFQDAGEQEPHLSDDYIKKCLNFQPKTRQDRLRVSDFNSFNYYSDIQKKMTYHLRAARKKNRYYVDENCDANQFSLD